MHVLVKASAYANNEVAFIAWETSGKILGCLGFEVFRQYLDSNKNIIEEVPLAAYVAFKGQANPDWKAQNTCVWPIQKFSWRDLTLRKKRDGSGRRQDEVLVQYKIRPVGRFRRGLEQVIPRQEMTNGVPNTYSGTPLKLAYLSDGLTTNPITITRHRTPFETTFTNGILSGQWLTRALLSDDGKIGSGELKDHLIKPHDPKREYLFGDVMPLIKSFFAQQGGRFYIALYELEDAELEELIVENASRISLILSNTGQGIDEENDASKSKSWDARNAPARRRLIKLASTAQGFKLQHRMFNNSVHIGHNKFVVWVDDHNKAQSVLTGSTNWTWSGLTGQSNNCIKVNLPEVADKYYLEWQRLFMDELTLPQNLGDPVSVNQQSKVLRLANAQSDIVESGTYSTEIWFSPNVQPRKYPKNPDTPPDLSKVFSLMRQAKQAILFLSFYPSMQGKSSIIEEAVNLGLKDKSLLVVGAVSAAEAMFNFKPKTKASTGEELPRSAPFVYSKNKVSVVRASALTDQMVLKPFGDFKKEILKAGIAIIHDKIMVIDPLDPINCVVVLGSHNLGFKASYSNDENMLIIRGHQALAEAYSVHILDVYDHYRFRAAESELQAEGKKGWDGFLSTKDDWQDRSSTTLSAYFA